MANTINPTAGSDIDKFIEITVIDSDWTWTDTFPGAHNGIAVDWIAFSVGATATVDVCSIKEGSATGPSIFPTQPVAATSPVTIVYYNGKSIKPYLDQSACTLSTGHSVIIKLS